MKDKENYLPSNKNIKRMFWILIHFFFLWISSYCWFWLLCIFNCSFSLYLLHVSSESICSQSFCCKKTNANFVTGTNFCRWMSAYKFQVFITISINSLSLPKLLCDTTEINNIFNLQVFLILSRIIFIR